MQEIRCPNCGEVFQVDESGYAQIAQQVRDSEFEKELARRESALLARQDEALKLAKLQQERAYDKTIGERDAALAERTREIERLKEQLKGSETEKKLAVAEAVQKKTQELAEDFAAQREDMLDYYTTWVHQIKTPIAVMKLYLAEETPEHRAMAAELFRMEQYVDMVLQYLRLGSGENDLVIEEYKLDELIRETVRKFAAQFVLRKLRLTYVATEKTIVTDRKWFCCILEQLLSNAIKYTPEGGVTVAVEGDKLYISDTGIGIAPEDLPRIFEKGYTGQNGRLERSASGLGLYLTRRAAELLHIPIAVESRLGQGTTFTLHLEQK